MSPNQSDHTEAGPIKEPRLGSIREDLRAAVRKARMDYEAEVQGGKARGLEDYSVPSRWIAGIEVPEEYGSVPYVLATKDLTRLEKVAGDITGPIVDLVAQVAAERDQAIQESEDHLDQYHTMVGHLAAMVSILQNQGFTPTFAQDTENWSKAKDALAAVYGTPARTDDSGE